MSGAALHARGLRPIAELGGSRPHGTRLRYLAGCKCFHCRRANSDYERERQAARLADPTTRVIRVQHAREWNHELLWNLRHVSNIKRSLRESLQEVKP